MTQYLNKDKPAIADNGHLDVMKKCLEQTGPIAEPFPFSKTQSISWTSFFLQWLASEEGQRYCHPRSMLRPNDPIISLPNRLEAAFMAGMKAQHDAVTEIPETDLSNIKQEHEICLQHAKN